MKRISVAILFAVQALTVSAQMEDDSSNVARDIQGVTNYKLYPTANMFTFLKLDTRNGRLWQLQWSFESETRLEEPLSEFPLTFGSKEVAGRFVLYPTENNYNFILLDQMSGCAYQVQWAIEPEKRALMPILPKQT